jgi:hypothetical protein
MGVTTSAPSARARSRKAAKGQSVPPNAEIASSPVGGSAKPVAPAKAS